jgi:hypothetical protein
MKNLPVHWNRASHSQQCEEHFHRRLRIHHALYRSLGSKFALVYKLSESRRLSKFDGPSFGPNQLSQNTLCGNLVSGWSSRS